MAAMTTEKVIFLDFDGVLNSARFLKETGADGDLGPEHLDPKAIARLNQLVEATGAVVVVSSSWRIVCRNADLRGFLKEAGFTGKMVGTTPHTGKKRGFDIEKWLIDDKFRFPESNISFVILDDDADMVHLSPFLVQTSFEEGLQDIHIARAKEILDNQPKVDKVEQ